jgi:hypothetical protein
MDTTFSLEMTLAVAERASTVEVDNLDAFCVEEGLLLQDVTSWSTAWHSGGPLAVRALVVQTRPTEEQIRLWREDVRTGLKIFRPRTLRLMEEGNWFTVEEMKALTIHSVVRSPLCQLRAVVDEEGGVRWFLYWRRAGGTWWPYAGRACFVSAQDALAEVKADPHRCFRLHPMA